MIALIAFCQVRHLAPPQTPGLELITRHSSHSSFLFLDLRLQNTDGVSSLSIRAIRVIRGSKNWVPCAAIASQLRHHAWAAGIKNPGRPGGTAGVARTRLRYALAATAQDECQQRKATEERGGGLGNDRVVDRKLERVIV